MDIYNNGKVLAKSNTEIRTLETTQKNHSESCVPLHTYLMVS